MISDTDFDFINSCIGKFENARFIHENNSKYYFPNFICQIKHLEHSGFAVAVIPFLPIRIEETEPTLYGTIQCYKKNFPTYIHLKAKGKIVRKSHSPNYFEFLTRLIKETPKDEYLLMTFFIQEINFVEIVPKQTTFFENSVKYLFKLLNQNPPHYRTKDIHSIHYNWF